MIDNDQRTVFGYGHSLKKAIIIREYNEKEIKMIDDFMQNNEVYVEPEKDLPEGMTHNMKAFPKYTI